MNTTKLYGHTDGFILETESQNYLIKNDGVYLTTDNGQGDPQPFDIAVQAVIDNALTASVNRADENTVKAIQSLIQEKIEDLD